MAKVAETRTRTIMDMLISHVEHLKGTTEGQCALCGTQGVGLPLRKVVSGNFTAWSSLELGDIFCETCASVYKDQRLRRKSWVVDEKQLTFFKRAEARNILFNPPDPPFFIHIATRGQKQTWLALVKQIAVSRDFYVFSYESIESGVWFEREKAQRFARLIDFLRNHNVTKTELRTGFFGSRTWRKAFEEGFENELEIAQSYVTNPLWEVLVNVSK